MAGNRSMQFVLNTIYVVLITLFCAIVLLQPDDNPDPETAALLNMAAAKGPSSAWFYLLGIGVDEELDPLYTGRQRYDAIVQAEAAIAGNHSEYSFTDVPGVEALVTATGDIHCDIGDDGCIAAILQRHEEIPEALKNHQLLLRRYKQYMSMDDFYTMTRLTENAVFPKFSYLMSGSRLVGLEAIAEAINGNTAYAKDLLSEDQRAIRKQLEMSDTLIHKMIMTFMLSNSIDTLVFVNSISGDTTGATMPRLSAQEKNMKRALANELELMADSVESIYLRQNYESIGVRWVLPVVRSIVKPGMTINAMGLQIKKSIDLSVLEHIEFSLMVGEPLGSEATVSDYIRNVVGTTFLNESIDFRVYIARIHDLDGKIMLYNHMRNFDTSQFENGVESFINPYFNESGRSFLTSEKNRVCFDGLFEDTNGARCIPTAIDSAIQAAEL